MISPMYPEFSLCLQIIYIRQTLYASIQKQRAKQTFSIACLNMDHTWVFSFKIHTSIYYMDIFINLRYTCSRLFIKFMSKYFHADEWNVKTDIPYVLNWFFCEITKILQCRRFKHNKIKPLFSITVSHTPM